MNNNEVQVTIKLAGADKFRADSSSALSGLNKSAGVLGKGLGVLGGVAKTAFAAMATAAVTTAASVGGAFAAITKNGIQVQGELETARQGFITLLGSAKLADKTLEQIKKDAAQTPFELTGLIQANQLLTSVTKDGMKSQRVLMNVGRALAAMGKGQNELDRIIVNLQQIGAVGRASMIDIKQFAFAGIPIFEMLQKETKLTGEALENFISGGGVTFEFLTKMFEKAGEGSGRFAKAFTNQAGTFQQLASNMKDTWNIFTADFVQKTGIFDFAKKAVGNLTSAMSAGGTGLISVVTNLKNGFFSWWQEASVRFSPQLKDLIKQTDGLKQTFLNILNPSSQTKEALKGLANAGLNAALSVLGGKDGLVAQGKEFIKIVSSPTTIKTFTGAVEGLTNVFIKLKPAIKAINDALMITVGAINTISAFLGSQTANAQASVNTKKAVEKAAQQKSNLIKAAPEVKGLYKSTGTEMNPIKKLGLPKFEGGGVIGGNSYSGDRLLARVNSGEMVLNKGQQASLFSLLKNFMSNGGRTQNFNFNAPVFSGTMNRSPMQQENLLINLLQQVAR